MKDKNGIEIECENCDDFIPVGTNGRGCALYEEDCEYVFGGKRCIFKTSSEALEARIAELQKEIGIIQESERAEAQEADRLREEVQELEKKLTETIKLLSERSRECGELEAEVKILKAFVLKVHTSPVIFEDVNRALRDEAKTLLEKLNQSAESEEK